MSAPTTNPPNPPQLTREPARMAPRTVIMLVVAAVTGLAAFGWPLLFDPGTGFSAVQAPLVFALTLPLILAVILAELTGHDLDVKGLALLGILSAVGAILRPLSPGIGGLEPIFFVIILGGRVFGPGFGFAQGTITVFASAFLTAGVGPWLPYQMIAAGFVGLGAGLLPRTRRRWAEVSILAAWGFFAGFAYGWLMDFAFWPFAIGPQTQFSFDPDASAWANLHTFVLFNLATSMAWNLGRALTNVVLIVLAAPALLRVLRRAARRAAFAER